MSKSKGLGDTVKRVIKKIGLDKSCTKCEKRQQELNKLFPYKDKSKK